MNSSRLWTRDEVKAAILKGDALVIYDSSLLRVTPNWLTCHPGGALAILHFVGRDATDEINAYHGEEAMKRLRGFVVGRVEMDDEKLGWEPLVPPVAQGWVRRRGQWENEASATRSEDLGAPAAQRQRNVPSEILLVAKEGQDGRCSTAAGPSLDSLAVPPATLSLAQQTQHSVAYRELHARVKAAGLYQTRYVAGYGPEVLRYLMLAATSFLAYRKAWFLTSAFFLGCLWHQLSFIVHDLGHMGVTHRWAVDRVLAILLADCIGGLSIGWWVDVSGLDLLVLGKP